MWLIFGCAGLGLVQSALGDRGHSLVVALAALCSAILAELAITWRKSGFQKIKDGSAAASALVLTLLLPNRIHPLYAALGALFAMAVVKHSFGGLGSNWLNPGLGGWFFVRFSWPGVFGKALEGAVSFESVISGNGGIALPAGSVLDGKVSAFLNNHIFSFLGAELPSGYIDLLVPEAPGIIADRGLLALLAGTIIITACRVSRAWAAAVFLAVFGILVMLGGAAGGEALRNGDVLFGLCSGGTVVAAFMLVTEPVSGAKSRPGMLFAAVLSGVLAWLFRYRGLEWHGCFFALGMVNAFTQVIRLFEGRWFYSRKWRHPAAAGRRV
jgi:electron transport complex protein RnfD